MLHIKSWVLMASLTTSMMVVSTGADAKTKTSQKKSSKKTKKKKKKYDPAAHPHIEMMTLRLVKFVPPSEDALVRGIDNRYTIVADGPSLRRQTIDFLVREFAPEALGLADMPDVAAMLKVLKPITVENGEATITDLKAIQKRALSSTHKDKEVRLKMVGLIAQLRSLVTRMVQEELPAKMSKAQIYTHDSFEADKMGDDLLKIFRFTIDADIDEMRLAPILNRHVRTLIVQTQIEPEPGKKSAKKKRKK